MRTFAAVIVVEYEADSTLGEEESNILAVGDYLTLGTVVAITIEEAS